MNIKKLISTRHLFELLKKKGLSLLLLILTAGTYLIWPPIGLLICPGMSIICMCCKNQSVSEFGILSIIVSFAFWITLFWFLLYIPVSLTFIYHLICILSFGSLYLIISKGTFSKMVFINREDLFVIGIFFLFFILRSYPALHAIAPAGADMSMHTYITQLITTANGIPSTYIPILNIDTFDTFPVGFHTLSAIISITGQITPVRATIIVTIMSHFLFSGSIYLLLKYFFSWKMALFSCFWISFYFRSPQDFSSWGGNPTILAYNFAILFTLFFIKCELKIKRYIPILTLCLSAMFLTHTIIFIQSFYILLFSLSFYTISQQKITRHHFYYALIFVTLFFMISIPYTANLKFSILTQPTMDWIKNWVRNHHHVWHGSITDFYYTIPDYIFDRLMIGNGYGYATIGFVFLGMYALLKKNIPCFIFTLSYLLVCIGLILNAQYWILPYSFAIYPERVAIMATIPLSMLFAAGLVKANDWIKENVQGPYLLKIYPISLTIVFIVALGTGAHSYYKNYARKLNNSCSVTSDDIKGFEYLANHTNQSDIIINNYGDGGLWIPNFTKRAITTPHINVAYLDKVKPWDKESSFIFVGSKCIYKPCAHTIDQYQKNDNFKRVFQSGNTAIFKVKRVSSQTPVSHKPVSSSQ